MKKSYILILFSLFLSTALYSKELTLSLTKYAIDHRFGPATGNIWYELGNNYLCPDLWNPVLPAFMEKRFLEVVKKRDSINDPMLFYYYPDELDQLKGFADYADNMG